MLYEVITRFLRLMPRHFDALHLRGQLAHRQQDLDTAVRSYSSAISLQPLNPIPYYNLGLYLQEVGKLTEAQRLYEIRITSYNVCYTKLLRSGRRTQRSEPGHGSPGRAPAAGSADRRPPPG